MYVYVCVCLRVCALVCVLPVFCSVSTILYFAFQICFLSCADLASPTDQVGTHTRIITDGHNVAVLSRSICAHVMQDGTRSLSRCRKKNNQRVLFMQCNTQSPLCHVLRAPCPRFLCFKSAHTTFPRPASVARKRSAAPLPTMRPAQAALFSSVLM